MKWKNTITSTEGIRFVNTREKPLSTFFLDVNKESYLSVRDLLEKGSKINTSMVKPEEFINYFDYNYPLYRNEPFEVYLEVAPSPFRPGNYDFRIGIQAGKSGVEDRRASQYVFLVDARASSNIDLIRKALLKYISQLRSYDKVSILSCENTTKVVINKIPVGRKYIIERAVSKLLPGVRSNLSKGVIDACQFAEDNIKQSGVNRILIFSDVIPQIKNNNEQKVLKKLAIAAGQRIDISFINIGTQAETKFTKILVKKRLGKYLTLKDEKNIDKLLNLKKLGNSFEKIVWDMGIQVGFNPNMVRKYRLIGYKKPGASRKEGGVSKPGKEDFASGQTVTAIYELQLDNRKLNSSDVIATIKLQYQPVGIPARETREYFLNTYNIVRDYQRAGANYKLAVIVAEFAEYLKYPYASGIAPPDLILQKLLPLLKGNYRKDPKVRELYNLIESTR